MVFKKGGAKDFHEGGVHTGTEAWNIAQYYTGFSIALPLRELNEFEDIARFGSVKMDEDLQMPDDQFDKRRAEAVKRYWQRLKQIILDTLFKVKAKDREEAKEILDYIMDLPKYFDGLLEYKQDNVHHEDQIQVNEDFLTKLMDRLVEKKKEYLFILDRTGLIFREVDEVDLDKITSEFVNGG